MNDAILLGNTTTSLRANKRTEITGSSFFFIDCFNILDLVFESISQGCNVNICYDYTYSISSIFRTIFCSVLVLRSLRGLSTQQHAPRTHCHRLKADKRRVIDDIHSFITEVCTLPSPVFWLVILYGMSQDFNSM